MHIRRGVIWWLRYPPLNQGIGGASPTLATAMFPYNKTVGQVSARELERGSK
jgi:hypothetical protein